MKLFMFFVLALFFQATNFAFSRQKAPSQQANTKTVIDSFINLLKIKNYYANQEVWKLITPIQRTVKTLNDVLNNRVKNRLVTSELTTNMLRIETTKLGDSVLQGYLSAMIIMDEQGDPIQEVQLRLPKRMDSMYSDAHGIIILRDTKKGDSIQLRVAHLHDTTLFYLGETMMQIVMRPNPAPLIEVENTGFRQIVRNKNTSYTEKIDTTHFSTAIGNKVLDRINRALPGYLEPRVLVPGGRSPTGSLRSPGSIRVPNGLIFVVENQVVINPDMINPDDIESLIAVRDAPVMSLYGIRAKSGVIIIKLKAGRGKQIRMSGTFRAGISKRPDLWKNPIISSKEYIEMEESNYKDNVYREMEVNRLPLSPIIEGLIAVRNQQMSEDEYKALKRRLANTDIRDELSRIRFHRAFFQQHHVNFSTGNNAFKVYGSVGYSYQTMPERGNSESRATTHFSTYYAKDQFSWQSRYFLTDVRYRLSLFEIPSKIPYLSLVDGANRPLPIPYFRHHVYLDSLSGGGYLDWKLRPYQEWQLADNAMGQTFSLLNHQFSYKLFNSVQLHLSYQYTNIGNSSRVLDPKESFYVRNEVNLSGKDPNDSMHWLIPYGDILKTMHSQTHIHDVRFQADKKWSFKNVSIATLAGIEIQMYKTYSQAERYYAYLEPGQQRHSTFYAPDSTGFLMGRFQCTNLDIGEVSSFSLSVRNDQTNVLGRKKLTDGLFYSLGSLLNLDRFGFYPPHLPCLSLRASVGETGNDNHQIRNKTTIRDIGSNPFGLPVADIEYSANSRLKPEKVRMINTGFRLSTRDTSIIFTLDYYWTVSKNLIGSHEINSTAGYGYILDNSSGIAGRGFDLYVEYRYGKKSRVKHNTRAWLSYSINKVTSEETPLDAAWKYASNDFYSPVKNYPLNSIFAFPLGPLNGQTGNPVGYLEGKPSEDAKAITESPNPDDIKYIGSALPLYYGSVTHSTQINSKLDISLQFSGRFKYFYRAPTYTSTGIIDGTNNHADYLLRWRAPGDERITNIPAFQPQPDKSKERLYALSEDNTHRADHIKFEFVQVSYTLNDQQLGFLKPTDNLLFCLAVWNLGFIWRKNKLGHDPEAVYHSYSTPRSYSLTVKININ